MIYIYTHTRSVTRLLFQVALQAFETIDVQYANLVPLVILVQGSVTGDSSDTSFRASTMVLLRRLSPLTKWTLVATVAKVGWHKHLHPRKRCKSILLALIHKNCFTSMDCILSIANFPRCPNQHHLSAPKGCWCVEPNAQRVFCTVPWWGCAGHAGTAMWCVAPENRNLGVAVSDFATEKGFRFSSKHQFVLWELDTKPLTSNHWHLFVGIPYQTIHSAVEIVTVSRSQQVRETKLHQETTMVFYNSSSSTLKHQATHLFIRQIICKSVNLRSNFPLCRPKSSDVHGIFIRSSWIFHQIFPQIFHDFPWCSPISGRFSRRFLPRSPRCARLVQRLAPGVLDAHLAAPQRGAQLGGVHAQQLGGLVR